MLFQARDARGTTDEAKVTGAEKAHELLLARENAIAARRQADALLSKSCAKFQELRMVVGRVCAYLSSAVDWRRLWLIACGSCLTMWSVRLPRGRHHPWSNGLSF